MFCFQCRLLWHQVIKTSSLPSDVETCSLGLYIKINLSSNIITTLLCPCDSIVCRHCVSSALLHTIYQSRHIQYNTIWTRQSDKKHTSGVCYSGVQLQVYKQVSVTCVKSWHHACEVVTPRLSCIRTNKAHTSSAWNVCMCQPCAPVNLLMLAFALVLVFALVRTCTGACEY